MNIRFAVQSKVPRAVNQTARTIRYIKRQCSLTIYAAVLCALTLGVVNTLQSAPEPSEVVFVQPEVGESPLKNTTGHIDLVWAMQPASESAPAYELQGARSDDFAEPIEFYSGLDERTFLSGLGEGAYFFRVRALDAESRPGEWSEVLSVEVDYVERWQVYILMLIGLLCLAATVYIIIRGSLRTEGALHQD